ncbi:quinol:electron acceptor oxidoreductase subunit ActD [Ottowia sp.]|uniref:quinol:electron acceptor oxidoreductase subunit ActD n=1 Tax=Ottowia sp. TaxID=1898956 RepID=UPI0026119157|nr:quinol:electron acceptor oxidoreductase subunit ActD [Ottowia sp.]
MNTASTPNANAASTLGDHLVLALFGTHDAAEAAVRQLGSAGVPLPAISIVGRNYHSEEHAVGYVNAGERAKFFGKLGAFWGGLAGILLGSAFMFIPVVGHVVVLGPLASMLVSGLEGAVVGGGASALMGALTTIGIPKDSVVRYETAIKADQFLVSVHASQADVARIQQLLTQAGGTSVESHGLAPTATAA